MFGKVIFRLRGHRTGKCQLRSLVTENRKAAVKSLMQQRITLVNPRITAINTVIEGAPGWKRFSQITTSGLGMSDLGRASAAADFNSSKELRDLLTGAPVSSESAELPTGSSAFGKVVNR